MTINIYAAWIAFLLGCIAGAVPGLFLHRGDWLGGCTAWPRRMVRLAHISFFGIRVCDEELLRLGLTLAGFVERSKTISRTAFEQRVF